MWVDRDTYENYIFGSSYGLIICGSLLIALLHFLWISGVIGFTVLGISSFFLLFNNIVYHCSKRVRKQDGISLRPAAHCLLEFRHWVGNLIAGIFFNTAARLFPVHPRILKPYFFCVSTFNDVIEDYFGVSFQIGHGVEHLLILMIPLFLLIEAVKFTIMLIRERSAKRSEQLRISETQNSEDYYVEM